MPISRNGPFVFLNNKHKVIPLPIDYGAGFFCSFMVWACLDIAGVCLDITGAYVDIVGFCMDISPYSFDITISCLDNYSRATKKCMRESISHAFCLLYFKFGNGIFDHSCTTAIRCEMSHNQSVRLTFSVSA